MKQIVVILGLIVLFAHCQDIESPQPNPIPPPFPPLIDGTLEVPWNNYGIDYKSMLQLMQQFLNQYSISELKVLSIDLRQNSISNINALDVLSQYTNLQELTIDLSEQAVNLQSLGDMSFVQSLRLRKFDLRAAKNKLTDISTITKIGQPALISRLSFDFSQNMLTDIKVFSFLTTFINVSYLTIKVNQNFLNDITVFDSVKTLKYIYQLTIYSYDNQGSGISLKFLENLNPVMNLKYFLSAETRICTMYGHWIDATQVTDWQCQTCYQPCSRCFGKEFNQCLDCANKLVYYLEPRDHQCMQILPNITDDGKLIFKYEKAGFTDLEMINLMYNFATKYTQPQKIKQLFLLLNDNNITSMGMDELFQITYYKYITYLEMNLNSQVPPLLDLGQMRFVKDMPLQTVVIRISDNDLTNIDFIQPFYKLADSPITRFELYLDGNDLTNVKAFKDIGQLVNLNYFRVRLEGILTDLSPLAALKDCKNVTNIIIYLIQQDQTVQTDYSFVGEYNTMMNLQLLQTYEGKLTTCDMTRDGQFIQVAADKHSWSCSPCYRYCTKCFGPAENQCLKCKEPNKLVYNPSTHTCDYKMPPVDDTGLLSINFNSLWISDAQFSTILNQFQSTYTTTQIKYLVFDIRDNNITSFAGLSMLSKYSSIITMELSLLDQYLPLKLDYTIISDFSQKLPLMDNFILDMRTCDTTQNYISVFDSGNQWKCEACAGQCQKCYGTATNQCNSCLDSPSLHFNSETHTCEFVLPPIVDFYLYIDLSAVRMQNSQLAGIMDQFVAKYTVGSFYHLDFITLCNPGLSDYTPLSKIGENYPGMNDVEFQLRQYTAPNQQDITFAEQYNKLTNITTIEMNWARCGQNQYISVVVAGEPKTYKAKCLQCFPTCLRCFGPQQDQCTTCHPPCKLKPDTHTCQC